MTIFLRTPGTHSTSLPSSESPDSPGAGACTQSQSGEAKLEFRECSLGRQGRRRALNPLGRAGTHLEPRAQAARATAKPQAKAQAEYSTQQHRGDQQRRRRLHSFPAQLQPRISRAGHGGLGRVARGIPPPASSAPLHPFPLSPGRGRSLDPPPQTFSLSGAIRTVH